MPLTTLPPDKGTPHRAMVGVWDRLWRAKYQHHKDVTALGGANPAWAPGADNEHQDSAPGLSRPLSLLIAGLFQQRPPTYANDVEQMPVDQDGLADLVKESTARAAGYGSVLFRPVSDGVEWQPSIVVPTNFAVDWAHKRAAQVTMWDVARDPRDIGHAGCWCRKEL